MSKTFVRLFIFLFLLVPWMATMRPAQADSPPRFTLAELGEKDIVVRTIYDQVTVHFPLAEGRQIDQAMLDLHLSHGKKLLPELSELIIALNDEPVASLLLTPENAEASFLRVELPAAALRPGTNTLLFRFNLRLKDQGCSDADHPSLWAKIFNDTALEFQGMDTPIQPNLGRFPAPFDTLSTLPGNPQLTLVLPSHPTPAELTAATQIAASLGQAAHWENPPLSAVTFDYFDPGPASANHLIAISNGDRNPLAAEYAPGLSVQASPYNPNRLILVVKGANESELLQAADMLSTRSARASLFGTVISPVAVQPLPLPEREARISFADLGYANRRVRGIGLHDLYYPIDIPYDWKITSDATIEVFFTHALGLTSDTASLMSAFVNGFKVSDVPLTGRNARDGRLVIQLAPRQLHPGRNWLHLTFDLHLRREDCSFRYLEEAWAEISAVSVMNLAHVRSEPPLNLRYLPSPLLTPADLSENLFVLAAEPTKGELTALVRLAAKLGTYTEADGLRPQATTIEPFNSPDGATPHLIAIGQPARHTLLAEYNDQLPQPLPLADGTLIPSGGREPLPEELTGQAGYLELLPAPWRSDRTLLVLSAPDEANYLALIDIMPSLGKRVKAEGNLGIVTIGKVAGFEVGVWADTALSAPARAALAGLFFGAVITTGGIGFVLTRRRQVSQEVDDAE